MPNPFDPSYLAEMSAAFGPYAWAFYIFQVLLVAAGVYLKFAWNDNIELRKRMLGQLGMVLMAAGGVGVVLGALRLGNVSIFPQRLWFHLLLLVDLLLAGGIVYYARTIYPKKIAASQKGRKKSATMTQQARARAASANVSSNGSSVATEDEEDATSAGSGAGSERSRREARRERKRRKR